MEKLDKDWFLYTELVRNSFTEMERAHRVSVELMKYSGQKPYKPSQYLQIISIDGIDIYNPITADYLQKNEGFVLFKEHHRKGQKFFKKTYSVKLPTKEQIKILSDKYNSEWKHFISSINGVWNDEVIKGLGFKNGILAGYAEYEKAYQNEFKAYLNIKEPASISELKTSVPQQSEKGKDKKPKYIWKSKHALSEFYEKVNDNFFEYLSLDDFLDVFTENSNKKLNAINYKQPDTGYLLFNIKPYFIEKVQANYNDWLSTKILFEKRIKDKKAISEILNFHKSKKVEYKESIDKILKSLTPFIK